MSEPQPIDTLHRGREHAVCCWRVGELLIDPGPSRALPNVLAAIGDMEPRAILLTHIHFDHAGAAGTLVRMYPDATVYVHERGAPHMVDPSRLWDSASRLYGPENMDSLWGPFEPVPADRLEILAGGETINPAGERFEVAYTPGHAKHHVSYLHGSGMAFVGDTGGVRIEPGSPVVPPTPPPDIDLDAWHRSIELIGAWAPDSLGITHYGQVDDPPAQLAELSDRLDRWAESARGRDLDAWVADIERDVSAVTTPEVFAAFRQATPFEQSYLGLRRYWDKLAETA